MIVTLQDYRPAPRYDGKAWATARLEGSADNVTFAAVETFTLTPDPDPKSPATRNFTTELATSNQVWFRIVWIDGDADEQPTSAVRLPTLAANALTSVPAVRTFLQKDPAAIGQDSVLVDLINRASAAIQAWTRREFTKTDATLRKVVYRPNPRRLLDLDPYDLRNITLVRYGTDGASPSPTTLTADDYRLNPREKSEGVWTSLEVGRTFVNTSLYNECEFEITGDWGFPSVPSDVEHWCIAQVAMWLRRDVAAFESTFNLSEDHLEHPSALASAVRAGLSVYRRVP